MPLSDFPVEIILNIADYLDDVDMNALVRTNKDAHSLLNETLYRQAMIRWDTTNKSHNMSLLAWAAENGVVGTIQRAVHAATGRHFNPVPESFHIALQVATVKGHVPIVELLLKVEGINPNFYSGSLQAPLLIAASPERGNSAIVELLLAKVNIDPDVRDEYNFSPLLYACLAGHVSIVRQLLARDNVDINCRGSFRHYLEYQDVNTPLRAACSGGNTEIISLLLTKHGIDVNKGNYGGNTPLMIAVVNNRVEGVKSLLARADVDPNIPNRSGCTALSHAVSWLRSDCPFGLGALEMSKILLERDDIDVNLGRDDIGRTALSWACINGCLELVDLILKKDNVDPNVRDYTGCTPLVEACRSTHSRAGVEPLEISKILLERDDIDVNLGHDYKGQSALSWACINSCLELVDLILKKDNVDPNVRDKTGCTPLVEACRSTHPRAGVEPLEISKILLERDDIDVNLGRDYEGRTALSWACINSCLELVDLILKKDNVDPNVRDNTGCTPLVEACSLTHAGAGVKPLEISKILLERDDIDVNLGRDYRGRTALSWACINGCLELVDLILKKDNIDPNIRDNTGRTPLAEACRSGVKPAVIRSLLSHRDIHPNTVDNNGVSPLAHFVKNYCLNAPPQSIQEIEALLLTAAVQGAISDRRIYVL
ncbi:Ankyrin repeat-containing domain protein [Elaphomyces granulatus]